MSNIYNYDETKGERNAKILKTYIDQPIAKAEVAALATPAVEESKELVKGGKKAFIGEKREFAGRMYIKTMTGWKFFGKGTGAKATEHHAASAPKVDAEPAKVEESTSKDIQLTKDIQLQFKRDYHRDVFNPQTIPAGSKLTHIDSYHTTVDGVRSSRKTANLVHQYELNGEHYIMVDDQLQELSQEVKKTPIVVERPTPIEVKERPLPVVGSTVKIKKDLPYLISQSSFREHALKVLGYDPGTSTVPKFLAVQDESGAVHSINPNDVEEQREAAKDPELEQRLNSEMMDAWKRRYEELPVGHKEKEAAKRWVEHLGGTVEEAAPIETASGPITEVKYGDEGDQQKLITLMRSELSEGSITAEKASIVASAIYESFKNRRQDWSVGGLTQSSFSSKHFTKETKVTDDRGSLDGLLDGRADSSFEREGREFHLRIGTDFETYREDGSGGAGFTYASVTEVVPFSEKGISKVLQKYPNLGNRMAQSLAQTLESNIHFPSDVRMQRYRRDTLRTLGIPSGLSSVYRLSEIAARLKK